MALFTRRRGLPRQPRRHMSITVSVDPDQSMGIYSQPRTHQIHPHNEATQTSISIKMYAVVVVHIASSSSAMKYLLTFLALSPISWHRTTRTYIYGKEAQSLHHRGRYQMWVTDDTGGILFRPSHKLSDQRSVFSYLVPMECQPENLVAGVKLFFYSVSLALV